MTKAQYAKFIDSLAGNIVQHAASTVYVTDFEADEISAGTVREAVEDDALDIAQEISDDLGKAVSKICNKMKVVIPDTALQISIK